MSDALKVIAGTVEGVERYDCATRFLVRSSSRPEIQHLVDVAANNGFGQCACEQHCFRVQPHFDAGNKVTINNRCEHIRRAREVLLDEVISKLMQA